MTELITSKLSILITGDTNASGLSVLSDEYSYPISTILTFFMRPIELEVAIILAFVPLSLAIDLNFGSTL